MGRILRIPSAVPDLGNLRATLQHFVDELQREELPRLIGELEAAKAQASARLSLPEPVQSPNTPVAKLLDAKEMAQQLSVPESWLREAARQERIPCIYVGRYVRFDPAVVIQCLTPPQT